MKLPKAAPAAFFYLLSMAKTKIRCPWSVSHPLLEHYHDTEWGIPLHDDHKLFEFLVLDAFQAGLSWLTILKKREALREAFAGFDYNLLAGLTDDNLEPLMNNAAIIRNRLKIWSVRTNARAFLDVISNFGSFDQYIWQFVEGKPIQNHFDSQDQIPAMTPLAVTISKDLKKKGFTFVGPTIVYAFMQATGMVNDHITGCFRKVASPQPYSPLQLPGSCRGVGGGPYFHFKLLYLA